MNELYQALLFVNGSVPVDTLGTAYNVSINGINEENNSLVRKKIEEKGIRYLYKKMPTDFVIATAGTLLFYGLDNLISIENQSINFHKAFAYGVGGLKYICGLVHFISGSSSIITGKNLTDFVEDTTNSIKEEEHLD